MKRENDMNETLRTLAYVSVAVVVCLISWATSPAPPDRAAVVDHATLSDLTEVSEANSFKIISYDEELAKLDTFAVAKERGRWVIPSHDNYAADAEDQLRKIAGIFVDLKSIVQVSDDSKVHEQFGVIEPSKELEAGAKGVGRLITISDKKDSPLVNLIVGNKAEFTGSSNAISNNDELRYVRIAGQPAVHVAKISLDSLTTKFEQWIERDLLKMNAFDVKKIKLNDYSIIVGQQNGVPVGSLVQRMDTVVSQGDNNTWLLDSMKIYENNQPTETQLAEDEELNKTKIDDVKTALDDLKIIDVDRKPEILAKALQDDKLAQSREAILELQQYGFLVTRSRETNKPDILGFNGSVQVALKDGLNYRLIFGRHKDAEKGDSTKLNRYLMVKAEVDASLIPEPELEPELPEPAGPASEPAKEEAATSEETKAAEKKEEAPAETKKDEDKSEDEIKQEELAKKERERIKRDNQRKRDEHKEKLKKAEARAAELNARFNDWFYVVSDDVYKKVQLSRGDIVKDSGTASEGGFGPEAFRRLQREGIKGKPKTPAPPAHPGIPGLPQ
jgi:Domain of unknown function (DUF4340)